MWYEGIHKVSSNEWAVRVLPNDTMVILLRVHTCHMPKEAQPSLE